MGNLLPSGHPSYPELDRLLTKPEFRNKLRKKIRHLIRPRNDEVEDLENDVVVKWIGALPGYDSTRIPLEPFLLMVADRFLQNQLRDRLALKRDPAFVRSIGEEPVPAEAESPDFTIDLGEFIANLPEALAGTLKAILSNSVKEYLEREGLCRSTYRYRLKKIRELAINSGLKIYLRDSD